MPSEYKKLAAFLSAGITDSIPSHHPYRERQEFFSLFHLFSHGGMFLTVSRNAGDAPGS
jgi:hypothetical protein